MPVREVHTVVFLNNVNRPFTATACKISGLRESAHIHASKQYIWWSCNKSTLNSVHFNGNHSRAHTPKGEKQAMTSTSTLTQLLNYVLNGFQFGTFIGRFPSDGAANTAVNELKGNRSPDAGWPENVENAQVFPPAGFSLLLYHWVVQ